MISKCGCDHKYQDEKYGPGMRVHNKCVKKGTSTPWRCTVCGAVVNRESPKIEKEKK
jgi:hypothetical protein